MIGSIGHNAMFAQGDVRDLDIKANMENSLDAGAHADFTVGIGHLDGIAKMKIGEHNIAAYGNFDKLALKASVDSPRSLQGLTAGGLSSNELDIKAGMTFEKAEISYKGTLLPVAWQTGKRSGLTSGNFAGKVSAGELTFASGTDGATSMGFDAERVRGHVSQFGGALAASVDMKDLRMGLSLPSDSDEDASSAMMGSVGSLDMKYTGFVPINMRLQGKNMNFERDRDGVVTIGAKAMDLDAKFWAFGTKTLDNVHAKLSLEDLNARVSKEGGTTNLNLQVGKTDLDLSKIPHLVVYGGVEQLKGSLDNIKLDMEMDSFKSGGLSSTDLDFSLDIGKVDLSASSIADSKFIDKGDQLSLSSDNFHLGGRAGITKTDFGTIISPRTDLTLRTGSTALSHRTREGEETSLAVGSMNLGYSQGGGGSHNVDFDIRGINTNVDLGRYTDKFDRATLSLEGGSLSGAVFSNSDFSDIDVNSFNVGFDSLKADVRQNNGNELSVDSSNFALSTRFGLTRGSDGISLKQDIALSASLGDLDASIKFDRATLSLEGGSLSGAVFSNSDFSDIDVNSFNVGFDSLKADVRQNNGNELSVDSSNFALSTRFGLTRGSDGISLKQDAFLSTSLERLDVSGGRGEQHGTLSLQDLNLNGARNSEGIEADFSIASISGNAELSGMFETDRATLSLDDGSFSGALSGESLSSLDIDVNANLYGLNTDLKTKGGKEILIKDASITGVHAKFGSDLKGGVDVGHIEGEYIYKATEDSSSRVFAYAGTADNSHVDFAYQGANKEQGTDTEVLFDLSIDEAVGVFEMEMHDGNAKNDHIADLTLNDISSRLHYQNTLSMDIDVGNGYVRTYEGTITNEEGEETFKGDYVGSVEGLSMSIRSDKDELAGGELSSFNMDLGIDHADGKLNTLILNKKIGIGFDGVMDDVGFSIYTGAMENHDGSKNEDFSLNLDIGNAQGHLGTDLEFGPISTSLNGKNTDLQDLHLSYGSHNAYGVDGERIEDESGMILFDTGIKRINHLNLEMGEGIDLNLGDKSYNIPLGMALNLEDVDNLRFERYNHDFASPDWDKFKQQPAYRYRDRDFSFQGEHIGKFDLGLDVMPVLQKGVSVLQNQKAAIFNNVGAKLGDKFGAKFGGIVNRVERMYDPALDRAENFLSDKELNFNFGMTDSKFDLHKKGPGFIDSFDAEVQIGDLYHKGNVFNHEYELHTGSWRAGYHDRYADFERDEFSIGAGQDKTGKLRLDL